MNHHYQAFNADLHSDPIQLWQLQQHMVVYMAEYLLDDIPFLLSALHRL